MPDIFSRTPLALEAIKDPTAFRRLTCSLPQMAILTGVMLRLYRAYVLSHGSPESGLWVGTTLVLGVVLLLVMLTIHLANFTVRSWWWRAAAFTAFEAGIEILVSLVLTVVGLERLGSRVASLSDSFSIAVQVMAWRALLILPFTVLLVAVVTIVRRILIAQR